MKHPTFKLSNFQTFKLSNLQTLKLHTFKLSNLLPGRALTARHILAAIFTFTFNLHLLPAAVPLRWTVETSRVQPVAFDAVHGESIALEAAFKSYGTDVITSNQTAFLCWQTNGMGSAWWTTNATTSGSSASVLFTPDMDPGAPSVSGFIGLADTNRNSSTSNFQTSNFQTSSISYRALFTLRFRHGPGANPNTLPLPAQTIDCATVTFLNPSSAPWSGGGSGGGVSTNAVSGIITNHVTSGYLCTVAAAVQRSYLSAPTVDDVITNIMRVSTVRNGTVLGTYDAFGLGCSSWSVGGTLHYAPYLRFDVPVTFTNSAYFAGSANGTFVAVATDEKIVRSSGLEAALDSAWSNVMARAKLRTASSYDYVYYDLPSYVDDKIERVSVTNIGAVVAATNAAKAYADAQFSTNNAALVAAVTNLVPASAKSVTPHDPVRDCDWVLNVTNGVFYWTVKE